MLPAAARGSARRATSPRLTSRLGDPQDEDRDVVPAHLAGERRALDALRDPGRVESRARPDDLVEPFRPAATRDDTVGIENERVAGLELEHVVLELRVVAGPEQCRCR